MSYAKSFWIEHVEAWQDSELKRKEYAAAHGLNFKNFGWWIWYLEQTGHGPYVKPPRPSKIVKTDAQKTKQIDPTTPQVLEMWSNGVPVEIIAHDVNKTPQAVRLIAAYHKTRRPAWFLSVVRGKAQQASA